MHTRYTSGFCTRQSTRRVVDLHAGLPISGFDSLNWGPDASAVIEGISVVAMSSDFSVFPATKGGNPVKLKAKNVRELRVENIQLEIQNQEMEEKLNQLRLVMSKEKEERERSNGFFWKSGQVVIPTPTQDKENIEKISSGRIKFKVLKNPLPEPMKQSTVTKSSNTVIPIEKPKVKGKACGQCEMKIALLICLECGEDYCPACFAKIHQKGALKLHRSMPIQLSSRAELRKFSLSNWIRLTKSRRACLVDSSKGKIIKGKSQDGKLDVLREPKIHLNCEGSRESLVSEKDGILHMFSPGIPPSFSVLDVKEEQAFSSAPRRHVPDRGGLLLHGTFNEDDSAKSFSQALTEWRNQSRNTQEKYPVPEVDTDYTGNSEAQTTLTVQKKPFEVEFKENGINYMEKLMIKKNKRTPVNYVARTSLDKLRYSSISESERDLNDYDGLTAEEIEDHEHYVALFKSELHINDRVMNEPTLQIMELDKAPEEDLEETSACSVSEVKHGNEINSQQRLPGAEYPKTTPVYVPPSDVTPDSTSSTESIPAVRAPLSYSTPVHTSQSDSPSVRALISDTSPVQTMKKKQNNPLQSTYSVVLKGSFTGEVNDEFTKNTKASLLEDSKSMKYKTSNDNPSLDSTSILKLTKEFESIARMERNISLEYHGLKGFFTMGVDQEEVKDELKTSKANKRSEDNSKIISIGNSYWRPENSSSDNADGNIVHEIVKKAQVENLSRLVEHSFSPRSLSGTSMKRPLTGGYTRRPYSASSTFQISELHNVSRPNTATARPLSRAASEISEIEHIDKTDTDDPHSEHAEEQETLTVLERELDLIRNYSGNKEAKQSVTSLELFTVSRYGKRLTEMVEKTQTESQHAKESSPRHSMKFLQSRDGENDSYEDEEDLQDRLHVLLLQ